MASRDDWYRAHHNRDLAEMQGLDAEQRGVLWTLRTLIMRQRSAKIENDAKFLSGWCRLTARPFRRILAELVDAEALYLTGEGKFIHSAECDRIWSDRLRRGEQASEAGQASAAARSAEPDLFPIDAKLGTEIEEDQGDRFNEPETPENAPGADDPEGFPQSLGEVSRKFGPNFAETSPKLATTIEAEQGLSFNEPSTNHKTESRRRKSLTLVVTRRLPGAQHEAILAAVDAYHERIDKGGVDWPRVRLLDDKKYRDVDKLLKHVGSLDDFKAYLDRAAASPFINGSRERKPPHENWRADLRYLARVSTYAEVIEGKHDPKPEKINGSHGQAPTGDSDERRWRMILAKHTPSSKFWPGHWGPRPEENAPPNWKGQFHHIPRALLNEWRQQHGIPDA